MLDLAAVALALAIASPPQPPLLLRFRCWSERPEQCAAAREALARVPGLKVAPAQEASGWLEDVVASYRRSASLTQATKVARGFVESMRERRFHARVSLQGPRGRHWEYDSDTLSLPDHPAPRPRLPGATTVADEDAEPRAGELELAVTGAGGTALRGTERQVDGVLVNHGSHTVQLRLAHGCDLQVVVTTRGRGDVVALSPCSPEPERYLLAPAETLRFRGADVPSEIAPASFLAIASLRAVVDTQAVELRSAPLRLDYRKPNGRDRDAWTQLRPDCTPRPLPPPTSSEMAGSFMVRLEDGVDAPSFARFLHKERKLAADVSTPSYVRVRTDDDRAAALACYEGVEAVLRDVRPKQP